MSPTLPIDEPRGGAEESSTFTPSTSILENLLAGLLLLYSNSAGTGLPTGVPAMQRDRWVDVSKDVCPVAWLSGWEDDSEDGQRKDQPHELRTVAVVFDGAFKTGTTSASAQLDVWRQWIQNQCLGIPPATSPIKGIAIRVRKGKQAAIVTPDGALRAYITLLVDYRELVDDARKWG